MWPIVAKVFAFLTSDLGRQIVAGAVDLIDDIWKEDETKARVRRVATILAGAAETLGHVNKWTGAQKLAYVREQAPKALRTIGVDAGDVAELIDDVCNLFALAQKAARR